MSAVRCWIVALLFLEGCAVAHGLARLQRLGHPAPQPPPRRSL